jgi:hypothetical protein
MIRGPKAVIFDLFGTLVPGFSRMKDETARSQMAEELGMSATTFNDAWATHGSKGFSAVSRRSTRISRTF